MNTMTALRFNDLNIAYNVKILYFMQYLARIILVWNNNLHNKFIFINNQYAVYHTSTALSHDFHKSQDPERLPKIRLLCIDFFLWFKWILYREPIKWNRPGHCTFSIIFIYFKCPYSILFGYNSQFQSFWIIRYVYLLVKISQYSICLYHICL